MRRKSIAGLALLSVVLALSVAALPSKVTATDFSKVGVRTGDWAKYSIASTNSSLGPSGQITLVFTDVTGTIVTENITYYNLDGSKNSSRTLIGNVSNSKSTMYIQGYGNITVAIMWG